MYNNYYWHSFIALQDEIWGGADEEYIIYAYYALALGSKFMMETFLSLAIRLRCTLRHFSARGSRGYSSIILELFFSLFVSYYSQIIPVSSAGLNSVYLARDIPAFVYNVLCLYMEHLAHPYLYSLSTLILT